MADSPKPTLAAAYAHCEALLREHDKDRFLADLFLPASVRPHAQALHAFSFEIARLREVAREPMAGELRQQWWRDALGGSARGEVAAHPVAAALIDTLDRFGLERRGLEALIDARIFDLYDDPMPDLATLESYCRATSCVLFALIGAMVGAVTREGPGGAVNEIARAQPLIDEAADAAGLAYAFTGLIRAFAFHAAQGRLYLPVDMLRQRGSSPEEALGERATPSLLAAIGDWRAEACRHLAAARAAAARLPKALRPVFLPLVLVAPYLRQTEAEGYDPFRSAIELAQWRRQWILWRG